MKPVYMLDCPSFESVSPTEKVFLMFLIGGRDVVNSTRVRAVQSWDLSSLITIDTRSLSRDVLDPNKNVNPFSSPLFDNSLVTVYLKVFTDVLNDSMWTEHATFMLVEDDIDLLESAWLQSEVAATRDQSVYFYSLYKTPHNTDLDCIYLYCTQAFTITIGLMRQLVDLDKHT
jgi:hypothetical protein